MVTSIYSEKRGGCRGFSGDVTRLVFKQSRLKTQLNIGIKLETLATFAYGVPRLVVVFDVFEASCQDVLHFF